MADLTIGEVGVVLQVSLTTVNTSTSPPSQSPMNLSGATVTLSYSIAADTTEKPKPPINVSMTIIDQVNGIVSYTFVAGDLVRPSSMGKNGVFRYSIKIVIGPDVFYTAENSQLTIKDDSSL